MSQLMDVGELTPHAKNDYFFDDIVGEPWEEFKKSVQTSGIIEPLVISQDKVIVSGHQRLRAAKELGITQVPVEVRIYESDDELLKQLIETNIRQRGLGNGNPVKLGRCLKELERITGVRDGSAGNAEPNNSARKTQGDLAKELGMSVDTIQNFKKLSEASPTLQGILEEGKITPTSALKLVRSLSEEEQEEVASQIWEQGEKATGKDVDALIKQIKAKDEQIKTKDEQLAEKSEKIEQMATELSDKIIQLHRARREQEALETEVRELRETNEGLMTPSEEAQQLREALAEKMTALSTQTEAIKSLTEEAEQLRRALEEEKAKPVKEVEVEKIVEKIVEKVVEPDDYAYYQAMATGNGVQMDIEREAKERLEALLEVMIKQGTGKEVEEAVASAMAIGIFFTRNAEAITKTSYEKMARKLDTLCSDDKLRCVTTARELIKWAEGFIEAMSQAPPRDVVWERADQEDV